jgi:hypothetical protein
MNTEKKEDRTNGMARARSDMMQEPISDVSIYSFAYECDRQIVTDRDEERTGAPYCDGNCTRCHI